MSGKTIAAIRVDQERISPAHRQSGRFDPRCSQNAADALTTHGGFRGSWLPSAAVAQRHRATLEDRLSDVIEDSNRE